MTIAYDVNPNWKFGDPVVYFFEAVGLNAVKIGTARDYNKRLSMLQVGCPALLRITAIVAGDKAREKEIHEHFSKFWIRGEWFHFVTEIRNIDWICKTVTHHRHDKGPPPWI